jgi:uncharacterized protein
MHFIITAFDKDNSLELRMATRGDHLAYAKKHGRTMIAGPFLNDDAKPKGSMIIIEASDQADAEDYARNDPYAKAGLFDKVTVRAWTPALGRWLPA